MSLKHARFQEIGYLSFTSITAAYQTLLSLSDDIAELFIINSTDALILIKLPNIIDNAVTTTECIRMPAKSSWSFSGRTNHKHVCKGNIEVAYSGSAPTVGEISAGGVR